MAIKEIQIELLDYDEDETSIGLNVDVGFTDIAGMKAQIQALSLWNKDQIDTIKESVLTTLETGSGIAPTDGNAQRQIKYLCIAKDNVTGRAVRREFPMADLSLLAPKKEKLDLTVDPGLAFKTWWDATIRSDDDNATTLRDIAFVTRKKKKGK